MFSLHTKPQVLPLRSNILRIVSILTGNHETVKFSCLSTVAIFCHKMTVVENKVPQTTRDSQVGLLLRWTSTINPLCPRRVLTEGPWKHTLWLFTYWTCAEELFTAAVVYMYNGSISENFNFPCSHRVGVFSKSATMAVAITNNHYVSRHSEHSGNVKSVHVEMQWGRKLGLSQHEVLFWTDTNKEEPFDFTRCWWWTREDKKG